MEGRQLSMGSPLATIAERLDSRLSQNTPLLEKYRANPSNYGLKWGAVLGILDGLLILLAIVFLVPAAADIYFYLIVLNWTFFPGLLVGGLIGLYCQFYTLSLGHLYARLGLAEALFLVLYLGWVIFEVANRFA